MIKLAIAGATGRTGSAALRLAVHDERFNVVGALTAPDGHDLGTTCHIGGTEVKVADTLDAPCDVLVDFSLPEGTMAWLDYCAPKQIAMVIGPTGYTEEQVAAIKSAAHEIPIVQATNFSVGIASILAFIGKLARDLGDSYDVEIIETHHHHKVDAPSGTAITLVDAIADATDRSRAKNATYGRQGSVGARHPGEIGVHAVRMGEITGQHEIHFAAPGETISIRHTAHSRDTFAAGALRAGAWIMQQRPGLYTMEDVLSA